MTQDEAWDREVDLVVAGAGPAGLTAALVAALEGLDVLLCEKSAQVGGTGATSAGTLWIPENGVSRKAGYDDRADRAGRYLDALIGPRVASERRRVFLAEGPRILDDLAARAGIGFVPCGRHPDYRSNSVGAAVAGRAVIPARFDARTLGAEFRRVRPPIDEFMLFGGMMVGKDDIARLLRRYRSIGAMAHSLALLLRYLADRVRHPRGARLTMGNALVAGLYRALRRANAQILFDAALCDVVREGGGGRVVGAVLRTPVGALRIRAARGVVLATGGFAHNRRLRERFMPAPAPTHSMAVAENTGDGLEIGERVGAKIEGEEGEGARAGGLWTPVSITRRKDGSTGLYPHILLDRAKPGLIAVNAAGRRFVNEAVSYHDFVEAMFRAHEVAPSIPAYLLCDAGFVRRYGLGAIHPGTGRRKLARFERAGYVSCAGDVAALAVKLGVDPETLEASVSRHNRFAAEGIDADFGKGDTELNRFNGDPANRPNPCLGPISTPPFVAVAVWPADLGCSTGLATDADARVLDRKDAPIEGLYACGNDMASIMGGTYPGPGITLGPAVVFAHRAAMHAAHAGG